MTRFGKKLAANALYIVAAIAVIFAVWAIAAAIVGTEYVLPDIGKTFSALGGVFALPAFWRALGGTLLRCLISYAISLALVALLFYVCVEFNAAARIIEPIISALRTLPTMAVSLILAIWVGAKAAPVVLGVLVIMPMLYSALRARISTLPKELEEVAKICGANKWQRFFSVVFPYAAAALPESLSGAFSFNIKIVIAAEILMQTATSLGMLMRLSEIYLETASLIAMTFVAVVISVAAEYALRAVLFRALSRYTETD